MRKEWELDIRTDILVYLCWLLTSASRVGRGVGRADLARYIGCTPKTVGVIAEKAITVGWILEHKVGRRRGHGFAYEYSLSNAGDDYLSDNFERINAAYDAHMAVRLVMAQEKARTISRNGKPKKVSPKQKELL